MLDAVVVGAGLSGLACARALVKRGAKVVVLEARDRVGGRTELERSGSHVFDLGGTYVGAAHPRMRALIAELGLTTFPTWCEGTKLFDAGGKLRPYRGDIPRLPPWSFADLGVVIAELELAARRGEIDPPWTSARAKALDAETAGTWARRGVRTDLVRGIFEPAVRTIFGAEPDELSLLFFHRYLAAGRGFFHLATTPGGAQQDRVLGGAGGIAVRMAAELGEGVVLTGRAVEAIAHDGGGVRVTAAGETHAAARAVLAIPPLHTAKIRFDPSLAPERTKLAEGMPMASMLKVIVLYPTPFWRKRGFSGEVVSEAGPISILFDDSPADGSLGALLGFVGGAHARAWTGRSPESLRAAVLPRLERWFGPEASRPSGVLVKDWPADPWTGGCPTAIAGPGVLSTHGHTLRAPIGRVHFAGTETSSAWHGYMEGAVLAGERAASEVGL